MAWTIHNIHNAAFGRDARFAVADMLGEFDVHNVALLYDRALEPLGFVSEMVDIIEKGGYTVYTYMTAEDEPVSSELDKFVDFCRGHGVDALVSLGGGSTIDTTKLAGKVLANGGKTTDYLGGYTALNVGSKIFEPIIAIPTTAGTGSESCWGIMCLNEETGIKTFTRHPVTRAAVDPVYTMKLSAEITAYTGMDALAQAAECLVNTRAMPNWMADVLARGARRCHKVPAHRRARAGRHARGRAYSAKARRAAKGHRYAEYEAARHTRELLRRVRRRHSQRQKVDHSPQSPRL